MTNNEYIITKFGQNMYFNRFFEKNLERFEKNIFFLIIPKFRFSPFSDFLPDYDLYFWIVELFLKTHSKSNYFLL